MSLGFIAGVWIGSAICQVITGNFSCIIGRPGLICACRVSFGARKPNQSRLLPVCISPEIATVALWSMLVKPASHAHSELLTTFLLLIT